MRIRSTTTALLAGLAPLLGAPADAGAAATVDVSYELSETTFLGRTQIADTEFNTHVLASHMRIRYPSDSASSMPLSHGSITLRSLTITLVQSWYLLPDFFSVIGGTVTVTTASVRVSLLSPVRGTFGSGSTLAFATGLFRLSGVRHCQLSTFYCVISAGAPVSSEVTVTPVTAGSPFTLRGSAGPYGGARSTRHTVTGALPIPTLAAPLLGDDGLKLVAGATLVGREVLREAEGHEPKVIPEPSTLLLLGSGAAGLGLLTRTRRGVRRASRG